MKRGIPLRKPRPAGHAIELLREEARQLDDRGDLYGNRSDAVTAVVDQYRKAAQLLEKLSMQELSEDDFMVCAAYVGVPKRAAENFFGLLKFLLATEDSKD